MQKMIAKYKQNYGDAKEKEVKTIYESNDIWPGDSNSKKIDEIQKMC